MCHGPILAFMLMSWTFLQSSVFSHVLSCPRLCPSLPLISLSFLQFSKYITHHQLVHSSHRPCPPLGKIWEIVSPGRGCGTPVHALVPKAFSEAGRLSLCSSCPAGWSKQLPRKCGLEEAKGQMVFEECAQHKEMYPLCHLGFGQPYQLCTHTPLLFPPNWEGSQCGPALRDLEGEKFGAGGGEAP